METDAKTDDRPLRPALRFPTQRCLSFATLAAFAAVCTVVAAVRIVDFPSYLKTAAVQTLSAADATADFEPKPAAVSRQAAEPSEDAVGWAARLRAVDQLRQVLQSKKNEILRVQQDYRYGILEIEDETRRLVKHARIDSFAQAFKNGEVELLLRNIQRRQVYFEALEKPLSWIDSASEHLLFLGRRVALDLLVKDVAEGIDIQQHVNEIEQALEKYQPAPSRLALDPSAIAAPSLEVIGKRLIEQAKLTGWTASDRRNQEIEAEVCGGNVSRAAELSTLSLKGARCLAESDAKQLFLNRLVEMSPLAAEKLSQWPGEWLCINGLARLDPEAAVHLFTWRGQWLSLNGLSELAAETSRYLAGWSGRQLELMGLRKATVVDDMAQWEAAGGRLFVPDAIRPAIDQARRK